MTLLTSVTDWVLEVCSLNFSSLGSLGQRLPLLTSLLMMTSILWHILEILENFEISFREYKKMTPEAAASCDPDYGWINGPDDSNKCYMILRYSR